MKKSTIGPALANAWIVITSIVGGAYLFYKLFLWAAGVIDDFCRGAIRFEWPWKNKNRENNCDDEAELSKFGEDWS